ncbi:MAG: outer membrane protein transport protein [Candidatus Aminicenantes bacterium]|nr:MAG: outer membrane protein transport protein [Candidatus Aminicenantes bacterium]
MKIKKFYVASCIFFGFLCSLALGNGLNLNGLGTRSLSMGGAFVGLADDFSTIFWNPAGMAFFKQKYFGFYGTDIIPNGSYRLSSPMPSGDIHVVDAKTESKHYFSGMLAYYHPIGRNFVAGLGVYTHSRLGTEWDGADLVGIANGNSTLKWSSRIGVVTIAPGIAYNINDILSIGAALNINYGMFDVAMHAGSVEPVLNMVIDLGQYEESMKGWGYGAIFGILVRPHNVLSLGATFRTASRIEFSGEASISNLSTLGFIIGGYDKVGSTDLEREVTWPVWIAAGVAVYPTENLTVTADVQYTQWSHQKVKPYGISDIDVGLGAYMLTDYKDSFYEIVINSLRPMFWDDTLQLRFGAEYMFRSLAVRGGYYWDPSPVPDRTMNILLPSHDFHVFTFGLGYSLKSLQLEIGLEYLNGKERNIPSATTMGDPLADPDWASAMPGIYKMHIIAPNISLSYRF